MSISSMKHAKLFSQLSDEQQEVISGGNSFGFPQNFGGNFGLNQTSFLQSASALNTVSASGPQGSVAGGSSIGQLLKTNGANALGLK